MSNLDRPDDFHEENCLFLAFNRLQRVNFCLFRWVHPSLYEGVSVRWMVGRSVTCFFQMPIMDNFLYENHWGSLTLTLLNVLNVLNVLKVLNVLNLLNMPIGPIAQGPIAQRPIAQGPIDTRNNHS